MWGEGGVWEAAYEAAYEVWEGLLKVLPSLPPLPTLPTLPPLSPWPVLKKRRLISPKGNPPPAATCCKIGGGLGVGYLPIRASYWRQANAQLSQSHWLTRCQLGL
ncbi:MAG: hypothetical protein F6J93_33095 [Oscillatoria sp. SIO1A7]|nr:hypothetical protein [Oscillatoria sp. SIO1A7]